MTKAQRRAVRLHRHALRAWRSRTAGWFDSKPYTVRLLMLSKMHGHTRKGQPGLTLGEFVDWWN